MVYKITHGNFQSVKRNRSYSSQRIVQRRVSENIKSSTKLYCNSGFPRVQLEKQLHSISTTYFLCLKNTAIPSMVPTQLYIYYLLFTEQDSIIFFVFKNSTQENSLNFKILGWDSFWDMIKYVDEWQAGLQQSWLLWL